MSLGRFITFEGGEGCGKSTQARLLADALERSGRETVLTREPGGTQGAEAIRDLLLDPEGTAWNSRAEALLFAAARADHLSALIEPALAKGKWVVCDRFIDSSRAYQGGHGELSDEEILSLHRIGSGGIMPDLTILLEASPEATARRLRERDGGAGDRIGGRAADYHARVAQRFDAIVEAEPERVVRIAGEGTPQEVHARVMAALAERFAVGR